MKPMSEQHFAILRRHMVELIGIHMDLMSDELGKSALDERVAAALREVPRHLFVPPPLTALAYHDTPLPIGFNKTISQPFVGALMIDLLAPQPGELVLEVGTGLGYQAAIVAQLAGRVWSIEIVEEFAEAAKSRLQESVSRTWRSASVTARADGPSMRHSTRSWSPPRPGRCPSLLWSSLSTGGRMVIPIGPAEAQQLTLVRKRSRAKSRRAKSFPCGSLSLRQGNRAAMEFVMRAPRVRCGCGSTTPWSRRWRGRFGAEDAGYRRARHAGGPGQDQVRRAVLCQPDFTAHVACAGDRGGDLGRASRRSCSWSRSLAINDG